MTLSVFLLIFLYPGQVLDQVLASAPALGMVEETSPLLSSTCAISSSALTLSQVWTGELEEEQQQQHTVLTTITTIRYTKFKSY